MKKPHLLEMIGKSRLENILDAFTQATGVASIITNVDGTPITKPSNFSVFCLKYCRGTEKGRQLCQKSDSYGGQKSASTREIVIYNCLNSGLLDSAAPIIVEGRHVANVLCGQVLNSPVSLDMARERALHIDTVDVDGYLEALANIPIISFDRFKAIVKLMEVVTQTISELAVQKYLLYKHSRRYLEKLVNSVTDCIVATNNVGAISMVNDACAYTFGCTKNELIGRPLKFLFSDDSSRTIYSQLLQKAHKGNPRAQVMVGNDGSPPIPMQISLSRINIKNREMSGYVAVMRDITEEKRTEQMKEDLLGMLTHDLGNPVLSIQKAMQLLIEEGLGPLNTDQREIVGLAYQTGSQLYGMVTDFLDTYRDENGQFLLRLNEFDIIRLVRESILQVKLFARDKSLSFKFESALEHYTVKADCNRLKRVCVNLLENAVKYSPEKGTIKIQFMLLNGYDCDELKAKLIPVRQQKRMKPEIPFMMLSVSDEGMGIAKSTQRFVFDKFFATNYKNEQGRKGFGLGLAFCKLVVEAHGGQIWVTSPFNDNKVFKNMGCRFSFTLPV